MLPYIHFAGRDIPVYSLAAAAGIIAAVIYLKRMVKREQFRDLDRYLELAFLAALLGTAIGSKLLYLIIEAGNIIRDASALGAAEIIYKNMAGGFVMYGGMIGCFAALYLYSRRAKLSFSHLLSLMLPAFPLAHAIARCGCFAAGCCYGKETHSFFAVTYKESLFAPAGVPLVPVQLIEAFLELVFFVLLYRDSKKGMPGSKMLAKYLLMYGCARFMLEFLRGDMSRGFIGIFSVSQIISVICIAAGAIILIKSGKDARSIL